MRAAYEVYGLFSRAFFNSLTPFDLILSDLYILNKITREDNEFQERASKKAKDANEHPGMERFNDESEFWDEVDEANLEPE